MLVEVVVRALGVLDVLERLEAQLRGDRLTDRLRTGRGGRRAATAARPSGLAPAVPEPEGLERLQARNALLVGAVLDPELLADRHEARVAVRHPSEVRLLAVVSLLQGGRHTDVALTQHPLVPDLLEALGEGSVLVSDAEQRLLVLRRDSLDLLSVDLVELLLLGEAVALLVRVQTREEALHLRGEVRLEAPLPGPAQRLEALVEHVVG